ncbi:hypothetical protein ACJMK2_029788 [Sinanodonta woodiana]|uniref:Chromo domain-containing protein n=1 Tax=Sinanodonta woodiana TaxID=1069815 RepID=A0ABD3XB85_SINWO
MNSERTAISSEQLVILESLWDKGMTSKGKRCKTLILEAVSKSGLNENVVKGWIGNNSRKKNNRHYTCQKGYYCKGVSGYNLFVKKNKDKFSSISEWATGWKLLPQKEKNCYVDEARQVPKGAVSEEPKKARYLMIKKLANLVQELHKVGVSLACLGCIGNEQIELGAGQALQFFKERPHIQLELVSYCTKDAENKVQLKELRGQVQVHLNNLYSKAAGKNQKFPYKKVAAGQIRIEGLPEDVLPLQLPSHYGERKLKAFLKCQEIKLQNMDTAVHTESECPGMIQDPTNSLDLTEFQNTAVSHNILPALKDISPTTHSFIQSAPIEIPPVSHTNVPGLNNISSTTHNFIQSAPIEIQPVSHTISPPVQTTSQFTSTAPEAMHESTSTQGTCTETTKILENNQVEQTESHSQWTKSKANSRPPDVCLKRKLEHTNLKVYSVKAIHAQRKIRGIQQYLVEWEGYTMKEATWEPKRNIPEETLNSLWKKIT